MYKFLSKMIFIGFAFICLIGATNAPNTGLPGTTPSKIPPVVYPAKPAQNNSSTGPAQAPLPKPVIPPMDKPFGMPGVVGLVDGKWLGTDYLGHLSKNITVDIEVLKGDKSPLIVDTSALKTAIESLLKDEDFIPHADAAQQGPPLPFLHILIIIYPVDKDRYVIFTTCRLFEEVQVMRKDFKPAGYWQAITWENQDITVANTDQIVAEVKRSTETLIKAFIQRYQLYNQQKGET